MAATAEPACGRVLRGSPSFPPQTPLSHILGTAAHSWGPWGKLRAPEVDPGLLKLSRPRKPRSTGMN